MTKADLSDADSVKRLAAGCDVAVLAAATTGGASQSKKEPWRQVTNNILIDATCLQAMYDVGIRQLVYISSATVYQDFEGSIKECQIDYSQDPVDAHFGVGWAKRSSEKICEFWSRQGMKIVVLRVANADGYLMVPQSLGERQRDRVTDQTVLFGRAVSFGLGVATDNA